MNAKAAAILGAAILLAALILVVGPRLLPPRQPSKPAPSAGANPPQTGKEEELPPASGPPIKITRIYDVIKEYKLNPIAAESKYKGKLVIVSCVVREIKKGYITIGDTTTPEGVEGLIALAEATAFCTFDKSEQAVLIDLRPHQEITVIGQVVGLPSGALDLRNCRLSPKP